LHKKKEFLQMEVIIKKDAQTAAKLTADMIADLVKAKPAAVLGLATGRTMENLYGMLGEMHKNNGLDFSLTKTFNLDEYVSLNPADPNSYRAYMDKFLFSKINIDKRNTHLPDGLAADLEKAGHDYEELIEASGGIDLQLLGIGRSGHVGFNEPLSPLFSRTRPVPLTKTTYEQNSPLFSNPADMPMRAMTMGVGTILDARKVIMLVTGDEKADIIQKAIEGPLTSMISASAMQMHSDCVVILDEAAASKMQNREFYDWVYTKEPKFAKYR